ncbi:hypothetical protein ABK040_009033 [Willaertia magna]
MTNTPENNNTTTTTTSSNNNSINNSTTINNNNRKYIIYRDVFTNDILMTNYYKIETVFDQCIFKVKSHFVIQPSSSNTLDSDSDSTTKNGNDNNATKSGKNNSVKNTNLVNNNDNNTKLNNNTKIEIKYSIIEKFGYHERLFKKKEFIMIINGYITKLKNYIENFDNNLQKKKREDDFIIGVTNFIQIVLSKFNSFKFYIGPTKDINRGMIILQDCSSDLLCSNFYFFMDGLYEEVIYVPNSL